MPMIVWLSSKEQVLTFILLLYVYFNCSLFSMWWLFFSLLFFLQRIDLSVAGQEGGTKRVRFKKVKEKIFQLFHLVCTWRLNRERGDADIKTKKEMTKKNLRFANVFLFVCLFSENAVDGAARCVNVTFHQFPRRRWWSGSVRPDQWDGADVSDADWNDVQWWRRQQRHSTATTAELLGPLGLSFLFVLLVFFLFSGGVGWWRWRMFGSLFVSRPGSLLFWLLFLSWSISCRMYRKRFEKIELKLLGFFSDFFFPFCFKN